MPRDYAKKEAPQRQRTPGWVWMLSGIALGLFIAFLFYLAALPPSTEGKRAIEELVKRPQSVREKPVEKAAAPKAKKSEPEFDFYTILPEYEVAVPEEELKERKTETGDTPTAAAPPEQLAPGRYIIQVGSFRNGKDADRRKAQLALLGIVSTVQTVTINGDDTWHRVRIGPIGDAHRIDEVRNLLQDNAIEYMVLRQKG